jgi:hypothetical protein
MAGCTSFTCPDEINSMKSMSVTLKQSGQSKEVIERFLRDARTSGSQLPHSTGFDACLKSNAKL